MPTIRISEIVSQPLLKNFNSNKLHQIDKGGRMSTKSSKNEVKCALELLKDSTTEIAVIRQIYKDHRTTTFDGLKIGFERLGYPLTAKRDYPLGKTGTLYIRLPQGNYVHFAGVSDPESLKGIRPTKLENEIRILWLFEITQFKSEADMNNVISSFIRGKKKFFYIMYEFNPHPKKSHWTYEWLEKMQEREDAYIQHTNYDDLPQEQQHEWLGELALQEIETLKRLDYEQYKSIYLGLPANLVGSCFKEFDRNIHVSDIPVKNYARMDMGVDYGEVDATVYTLRGLERKVVDNKIKLSLDIPMTFYHKNGKSVGLYGIMQYAREFFIFAERCYQRYGKSINVWVDSANKFFIGYLEEERHKKGIRYLFINGVNKSKKDQKELSGIQERINYFNLLYGSMTLNIDRSCKELIKAIEESEYDKNQNRLDDGSCDIDSLDSLEYTSLDDMTEIKEYILRSDINAR